MKKNIVLCLFLIITPYSAYAQAKSDGKLKKNNQALIQEILQELNYVRQKPKEYAEKVIKPRLAYFQDKIYKVPGAIALSTREGAAAVQECITSLKKTSAQDALTLDEILSLASQWLADDQAKTARTGHIGSDGSNPVTRIERFGKWEGAAQRKIVLMD